MNAVLGITTILLLIFQVVSQIKLGKLESEKIRLEMSKIGLEKTIENLLERIKEKDERNTFLLEEMKELKIKQDDANTKDISRIFAITQKLQCLYMETILKDAGISYTQVRDVFVTEDLMKTEEDKTN